MDGLVEAAVRAVCTVVVPCYNEEARLPVARFQAFLSQTEGIRFLFVNDGSRDGTLAMLEELAAGYGDRVAVLDKQPNGGKAEAVRVGMAQAIAEGESAYVGFWDADLATPLDAIPDFLSHMAVRPQIEMVFGARVALLGRHIERKPMRHYLGRAFATLASMMLRLPIYDTQCGAKIFRVTPDFSAVVAQPFQSRWIFDVEIIARFLDLHPNDVLHVRNVIYEFPLREWRDVGGSKVRSVDFFLALGELLRIRRRYFR